ncbi:CDP-alcohol phosphatidyltransferase family protein [Salininema proteolyticum]|uniref:CDP-alcohol phosphatidyltransferase family protein n=1 Tax=Salininema proteolyticum TaxID=1607685 RepID=A0ABV8U3K8_9ACTN
MRTAVIVDDSHLLFSDGESLRHRLERQLTDAGVDRVEVLSGGWSDFADLAESGEGHLYLVDARLVASDTTVNTVLADSSRRSGVLVGTDEAEAPTLVVDRGLVVQEGPSTLYYGGLVKVSGAQRKAMSGRWGEQGGQSDLGLAVLESMSREGVAVTSYRNGGLPYALASTVAQAEEVRDAADAVDLRAWRLSNAVKADDDLFATYAVSSWSPLLVRLAEKTRLKPTTITWWSIAFALGSAGIFATGFSPWYLLAAALMYFSFVFDCVDGQLARFTQQFSSFGGWLDMMADRGKEYVIYAGLAWGATQDGHAAWGVALAAIVVQTVRHTADTWYAVQLDTAVVKRAQNHASGEGTRLASSTGSALGAKLEAASNSVMSAHRSFLYWAKRTIVAGVGDRWAVLAVAALVWGPQVGLIVLLSWQLFALAYTSAGRLVRTLAARAAALDRPDRAVHRDDGLLAPLGLKWPPLATVVVGVLAAAAATALGAFGADPFLTLGIALAAVACALAGARGRHTFMYDWLIPAGLRAVEFGAIIAAGLAADVPLPAVYALVFVIALYFYDLAAGLDKAASPVSNRAYGLGWPVRSLLAIGASAVAVSLGDALVATVVFLALAVYSACTFLAAAVGGMRATSKPKETPVLV